MGWRRGVAQPSVANSGFSRVGATLGKAAATILILFKGSSIALGIYPSHQRRY